MPPPLLGRDGERALCLDLLTAEGGAVVTLLGPAGVGKSALADALRAELLAADRLPGGAWQVSFASAPRALDLHVRASLRAPRGPLDACFARLGRALVVLDACESVADALAPRLACWRAAAPDLLWLLTSQRPLGLRDERAVPLVGLRPDDALALLLRRAGHTLPAWRPTPGERADLAAVARQLDGMPLALELAAARLAVRTPADLRADLATGILALSGGADLPPRHRSLRAALASSLDALDPSLRADLRALATLRGPFDAATAAALTARAEPEARARVAALVAASLAQRLPDGRARLFHAVRERAAEALDDDGRARHGAWFAARADHLAREAQDGDAALALASLRDAHDDLTAALDASPSPAARVALLAGLDAALTAAGGSELLDDALDHALDAVSHDPTALARAHGLRARGRYLRGHIADAARDIDAALALDGVDAPTRWAIEVTGSAVLRAQRRYGEALARAEATLREAKAAGERAMALRALHQAACARLLLGDESAARGAFLSALAEARAVGARRVEALCLTNLGCAALRGGDAEGAALRFEQGAAAFESMGDALMATKLAVRRATARFDAGDVTGALALADDAAQRARGVRDGETAAEAGLLRARCLERLDRHAEARVAREDAFAAAQALGLHELTRAEPPTPRPDTLRVGDGAYWFVVGGGSRVELGRRPNLRRILALLVERRASPSSPPATVEALFAAGWPGDRALPEAAAERVYTAVRTLRAMGLRGLLVRRDGGYALDPTAPLVEG